MVIERGTRVVFRDVYGFAGKTGEPTSPRDGDCVIVSCARNQSGYVETLTPDGRRLFMRPEECFPTKGDS